MSIEAEDTFTRPVYAGNAISTVKSNDDIKVFTVRASTWEAAKEGSEESKIDSQEAKEVGQSEFTERRTFHSGLSKADSEYWSFSLCHRTS